MRVRVRVRVRARVSKRSVDLVPTLVAEHPLRVKREDKAAADTLWLGLGSGSGLA